MAVRFELDRTPLSARLTDEILVVGRLVFGNLDETDVLWRLLNMPDLSVFSARLGYELVGFKIGYAVTSKRYYSWLGGVIPAHRRLGIVLC